jgi:hypothetical protein
MINKKIVKKIGELLARNKINSFVRRIKKIITPDINKHFENKFFIHLS